MRWNKRLMGCGLGVILLLGLSVFFVNPVTPDNYLDYLDTGIFPYTLYGDTFAAMLWAYWYVGIRMGGLVAFTAVFFNWLHRQRSRKRARFDIGDFLNMRKWQWLTQMLYPSLGISIISCAVQYFVIPTTGIYPELYWWYILFPVCAVIQYLIQEFTYGTSYTQDSSTNG